MKLSDLSIGESATIVSIATNDSRVRRLTALGVKTGDLITLERRSPRGNTLLIRHGGRYALRKDFADLIEVAPCS